MRLSFRKNIINDSILNIVASVILTIALQIIAYPFLALELTINEYGLILTLMGVLNAIGVSLGNSLNNTRILLHSEYEKHGINGDFHIIFLAIILIGAILSCCLSIVLLKSINITIISCIIITVLVLFRSYFSASFRIKIDYKKILYSNLWGSLGYLVGIIMTKITGHWGFVFIFGELIACIYIFNNSFFKYDRLQISSLFKKSLNKYLLIMLAAILSNIMMYMDRFFLYPFLGADQVAVYTVASFLGKTAGIVLNPIAGVLLTYYVKENQMTIKQFLKRTSIFFGVSFLVYLTIELVGVPITGALYPTLISEVIPYFHIANLAAVVFILGNTIQPTLLAYCDTKWQLIIQAIYFLLYLVLGYFGMVYGELLGFCYAILLANIIRVLMMILVVLLTLRSKRINSKIEL